MPTPDYNFIKWWEAGNGLGLQQLEALLMMEPAKEEEAKLSSYDGDINELQSVEKFFKAILRIPFAFLRAEIYAYCTIKSVEFDLWSCVSCFMLCAPPHN